MPKVHPCQQSADVTSRNVSVVYLQINLKVAANDRSAAAAVYTQFKAPFLAQAKGALSKELLIRYEDVQVLHSFDSTDDAKSYLASDLFNQDVVAALKPVLQSPPEIRIYAAA
jgi:hypothetical protein